MPSKITQLFFHLSDGINYVLLAISLIFAVTVPFSIGIMNGFEGAHYSTSSKVWMFIGGLVFAGLFALITRHNIYAVVLISIFCIAVSVLAKSFFITLLIYVFITGLPYVLAIAEAYARENT